MHYHKPSGPGAFLFATTICVLIMEFIPTAVGGENGTEILKITVGEPTKLGERVNQNTASLAVSRTGSWLSSIRNQVPVRSLIELQRISARHGARRWIRRMYWLAAAPPRCCATVAY